MRNSKRKIVALLFLSMLIAGITFLGLKMIRQKFELIEWVLALIGFMTISWVGFRFQKRRKSRHLESMRDSALW